MQQLSGIIFIIFLAVFGLMLLQGQTPPDQTLMEMQVIPEKGIDVQVCQEDSDCIPIREFCCECNQGGKRIAINRKFYKFTLDEKVDQCLLQSCQQADSNHSSCNGAQPRCVSGRCQMK